MAHIRGLEALEVAPEQYGSLLIPLVMAKFPNDTRLRIARGIGKGAWKIGPLLDILKEEVEAQEQVKVQQSAQLNQLHHQPGIPLITLPVL